MLYPARWKKITVDQSKVLKNLLYRLFRGFGATRYNRPILENWNKTTRLPGWHEHMISGTKVIFVCIWLANTIRLAYFRFPLRRSSLTHSERRPQKSKYLFPRGNKPLLYRAIVSSSWQHKFLYFHYKSVKLDVLYLDKIKYEHLAILSNLKNCQFAPRIVIFNLCIYIYMLPIWGFTDYFT